MKKTVSIICIGMLVITLLPMVIASEPTNQELKMNLVQSFSLYVTSQTIDNFMMLKNSILAIFNRLDELESRPKSCNHVEVVQINLFF